MSNIEIVARKIQNNETISSRISELNRAKKEYEVNKSGSLEDIEKIEFKGLEAVSYVIHINIPNEEISETRSVSVIKNDIIYLLRLISYGESLDQLSEVITENSLIFDNV